MDNTNPDRSLRRSNPDDENENRGRFSAWQHSSRIVRVSRATGGKDRHSKVLTSKGLRDRRVRLSVSTAIQFYDLQDRLGYDQPSKAVEWLIKAAEDAIAELPSLDTKFAECCTKEGGSDERVGFDVDLENDGSFQHHKSACSSTSETSKGSVLSLSRSESRVKARERARERTAKDKDKEPQIDECECAQHHNSSQNPSSFTELLNSGAGAGNSPNQNQSAPHTHGSTAFFLKQTRQSPPMSMDYFSTGLFGHPSSARNQYSSSGFSSHPHFGIAPPTNAMVPFSVTNDPHPQHHHPELQQFSFLPDHLIPESQTGGGDYNLNFSISSGLAGYNRGTLQSNSPSTLSPHFQRFTTSPADGSSIPFYIGNATASDAAPAPDNQFPTGFSGRLQLYYGDGSRHSDTKGKDKS